MRRRGWSRLVGDAGLYDTGHDELHVAGSNLAQSIFEREHLSLLGDANTPVDRPWRLPEDSFVDGASAASDGPAAPMKESNTHVVPPSQRGEPTLCLIKLPARGQ